MGGANNRSLIRAHFCISAYFLIAETYKRMRLTTRVYGNMVMVAKSPIVYNNNAVQYVLSDRIY